MRYFLDTEFDGKGGPLLSLALIREDGIGHYFVNSSIEARDPWVIANVLPVMHNCPELAYHSSHIDGALAEFLADDPAPVIVADWPDDVAYLCRSLTARSLYWSDPEGQLQRMPPLRFEVANVDAYPTTLPGAIQHNAWWDAMALRHVLLP